MKKLIVILLFPFVYSAQGEYKEYNFGLANIDSPLIDLEYAPGLSLLIGKRFEFQESYFLRDMQIGLALPSILTAKIGAGSYLNKERKSGILLGVRPWPLHLYTQVNLNEGIMGQWIISLEIGSALLAERGIGEGNGYWDFNALSMGSRFIVNFGYRTHLVWNNSYRRRRHFIFRL